MKKSLLFFLIFTCFKVRAQQNSDINIDHFDHGVGITLSTDYDVPIGNLAYSFKPAIAYGVHLTTFNDNFNINYSVGYEVFKPKLDTFYYSVGAADYGTISYQNFSIFSAYLGPVYNFRAANQFWIFAGLNLGAYYTRYAYQSSDKYVFDNTDLHEKDLYIAPKAGFTFVLSNTLLISLQSKYNFFAPLGKTKYNSRVGTLYNSLASGITLTYKFSK